MRFVIITAAGLLALALVFVELQGQSEPEKPATMSMKFSLISPAFVDKGAMPRTYTCDGNDLIMPPLTISGTPEKAKSLTLIVDDPDAPGGVWVHGVLFNIPPDTQVLGEGKQPPGVSGKNSWGGVGYKGPCPPSGTHRYVFTLYALDEELPLSAGADKAAVLSAMQGRVISEARLIGLYRRK